MITNLFHLIRKICIGKDFKKIKNTTLKVLALLGGGFQMGGFYPSMELHRGGSDTNGVPCLVYKLKVFYTFIFMVYETSQIA